MLLVAALKSGKRKFRSGFDVLYERVEGVLVWDLSIRKQVDSHWTTVEVVVVALITPNDGVVFPSAFTDAGAKYPAVVARRALLKLGEGKK